MNIETATKICSVALALDGKILSLKENSEGQSHAKMLTSLIFDCLEEANKSISQLQAISVSKGPGSFTGLRIGVASAKGLCYALNIPLISVNTLQSMAHKFKSTNLNFNDFLFCPMIDARRLEVYTAFLKSDLSFFRETAAVIIEPESFHDILEQFPVVFFGDGMKKTVRLIGHNRNAHFMDDFEPSASGMAEFSENSYNSERFESTAYFEPFYLKDFYSPGQPS